MDRFRVSSFNVLYRFWWSSCFRLDTGQQQDHRACRERKRTSASRYNYATRKAKSIPSGFAGSFTLPMMGTSAGKIAWISKNLQVLFPLEHGGALVTVSWRLYLDPRKRDKSESSRPPERGPTLHSGHLFNLQLSFQPVSRKGLFGRLPSLFFGGAGGSGHLSETGPRVPRDRSQQIPLTSDNQPYSSSSRLQSVLAAIFWYHQKEWIVGSIGFLSSALR